MESFPSGRATRYFRSWADVATKKYVDSKIGGGGSPVGSITQFAGSEAPEGWLICDGSLLSRADYAALFDVIGTTYNVGGESLLLFRLPNTQGRTVIGVEAASGNNPGVTGGEASHILTAAEMPWHGHPQPLGYVNGVPSNPGNALNTQYTNGGDGVTGSNFDNGAGGNQPHNNMPPYIVFNMIIKT